MNLEQAARLRQGVYRFLSLGFAYPTSELIETASGALDVLDGQGLFNFAFALDVAEAIDAVALASLDELEVSYIALFEAGVGGAVCSPHESAHRADPRLGEVAELQAEIRRTYLRFGLSLHGISRDMVDHIAVELDVMALLCRREAEGWGGDPSRAIRHQRELLDEHLLRWAPSLAGRVGRAQGHPAYTSLGLALDSFLNHERQWVPKLLETWG